MVSLQWLAYGGYSSVLKHLPHICETLGFVPSTTHTHIHNALLILCGSQKYVPCLLKLLKIKINLSLSD